MCSASVRELGFKPLQLILKLSSSATHGKVGPDATKGFYVKDILWFSFFVQKGTTVSKHFCYCCLDEEGLTGVWDEEEKLWGV